MQIIKLNRKKTNFDEDDEEMVEFDDDVKWIWNPNKSSVLEQGNKFSKLFQLPWILETHAFMKETVIRKRKLIIKLVFGV